MRRFSLLFASLLLSTPLWAMHCPADMAKIDEILKTNPPSDSAKLAKVKELRAEGEKLHNEGDHAGSVKALGEALNLLGAK
ncbi:hypothetical protein D3C76_1064960 [compost metagenome]